MTDGLVAMLVVAIIGQAIVILLQIFKGPKESANDLTKEMHDNMRDVKEDVEEIRADHHKLAREVSSLASSMSGLKESLDELRDQVRALSNVIGVYNANRSTRR